MYVVCYDIESDRIRNRVSKELLNYGKRVQFSVFECDLTKQRYEALYKTLCKITNKMKVGNIKIYSICENCKNKVVIIGNPELINKYKDEKVIVL